MKENKEDKLSMYLVIGLSIGAFLGTTIALLGGLVWHNIFIQVGGTGFGICLGMLVGNIIYLIKTKK